MFQAKITPIQRDQHGQLEQNNIRGNAYKNQYNKVVKAYFRDGPPLYYFFEKPDPIQVEMKRRERMEKMKQNEVFQRFKSDVESGKIKKGEYVLEPILLNQGTSISHFGGYYTISIPRSGDYDPYWKYDTTEYVQEYYQKPENGNWTLTNIIDVEEYEKTHPMGSEDAYPEDEYFETPAAQTKYFRLFLPALSSLNSAQPKPILTIDNSIIPPIAKTSTFKSKLESIFEIDNMV
jgi:hypothetical protein